MKFPKMFQRKTVTYSDIDISGSNDVYSVLLGLSSDQPVNLLARDAYYMAERSSDLGAAVNKISKVIASFILVIKENDGEIRYSDPVLDTLNNPGETRNKSKLLQELIESYLLTNESWIVLRGNITRPPLAIIPIRPYDVSIVFDESDGMPLLIQTQSQFDRRNYERNIIGGEFRYIDRQNMNEIIPIIGQANLTDGWRGRSPLNKLYYDVTMNTSGKRHNKSLLENGMRASAVISPKDRGTAAGGTPAKWSEKGVETLQKTIRAFHQGAGNAGNVMIVGSPVELQGMTQNNQEMDFIQLLKNSKEAIYNLYEIPLPLILSDAMTLSNYTVALRAFYTSAVYPIFEYVAAGITQGLRPRYKTLQREEILGFSEIDIQGMRPILVENMKILKDTEAVSVNEIRNTGGFDDDDDGDVILITASKTSLESLTGGGSFADTMMPEEEEPIEENENTFIIKKKAMKYNQHHGPDGRFVAGGGSSGGGGGRSGGGSGGGVDTQTENAIRGFTGLEYGPIRHYQSSDERLRQQVDRINSNANMSDNHKSFAISRITAEHDAAVSRVPESTRTNAALIESHIRSTTPHSGTIYRGIRWNDRNVPVADAFAPGNDITMGGLSSWSQSRRTATTFSSPHSDIGHQVIFSVRNRTGVDISNMSIRPTEREIIVSSNAVYRVISSSQNGNVMNVVLQER